jgi:phosphoglycerol transferase MdoB-like AlkP superfamily enzyme
VCLIIAFLLLTALVFGTVAAVHALWWLLLILIVMWLVGLIVRPRPRRGRWY